MHTTYCMDTVSTLHNMHTSSYTSYIILLRAYSKYELVHSVHITRSYNIRARNINMYYLYIILELEYIIFFILESRYIILCLLYIY